MYITIYLNCTYMYLNIIILFKPISAFVNNYIKLRELSDFNKFNSTLYAIIFILSHIMWYISMSRLIAVYGTCIDNWINMKYKIYWTKYCIKCYLLKYWKWCFCGGNSNLVTVLFHVCFFCLFVCSFVNFGLWCKS